MTVMWSSASFIKYLMTMMNKYLEGSIYVNYYYEGLGGMIGAFLAGLFYPHLRVRNSFVLANFIMFMGVLFIYLYEARILDPATFAYLGLVRHNNLPLNSDESHQFYLRKVVPQFSLMAKIGVNFSF